ncbi:MAG: enoyl-CoA hydratase/isomerase family protein, partial [Sphingomonadales bacterium]
MSVLLLEREGAVAKITLNRPDAANAFDMALGRALLDAAIEVDADASVRAVVLTGAGKMFCAGGDIGVMSSSGDKVGAVIGELASTLHLAMSRLGRMNKPLVNLINGAA